MHIRIIFGYFLVLAGCGQSADFVPASKDPDLWHPVFADEFDGTEIDTSVWEWTVRPDPKARELQYYTSRRENSYVQDGVLHLRARPEKYGNGTEERSYTSAKLKTYQVAHFGNPGHGASSQNFDFPSGQDTWSDFHTYEFEWMEEGQYRFLFYIDGTKVWQTSDWSSNFSPFPGPFDHPFGLIINMAVGGWASPPDQDTDWDQTFQVDYARVFANKKCAKGRQFDPSLASPGCSPCPLGTYKEEDGLGSCSECAPGRAGGEAGGAESREACAECPAGRSALGGSSLCETCAPGRQMPATGAANCTDCPVGRVAAASGSVACVECLPGRFQLRRAQSECDPCPTGAACPRSGMGEAVQCPHGTDASKPGGTVCANCSAGGFSEWPAEGCRLCPAGRFSRLSGRSSCAACAVGTYAPYEGGSACLACPPGFHNPFTGGSLAANCSACPVDTFSPLPAQADCLPCPDEKPCSPLLNATSNASCSSLCGTGRREEEGETGNHSVSLVAACALAAAVALCVASLCCTFKRRNGGGGGLRRGSLLKGGGGGSGNSGVCLKDRTSMQLDVLMSEQPYARMD